MTENIHLKEILLQILNSTNLLNLEVFLSGIFLALILLGLVLYKKNPLAMSSSAVQGVLYASTFIVLLVAFGINYKQYAQSEDRFLFSKMLFLDGKAIFFKGLILLAALATLAHSWLSRRSLPMEFFPLFIALILGLCFVTMSVNLLMIYLAIETVSIVSYILTGIQKDRKGTEAGLKYLLFGATSSAVMLYGMSLLYGMTGTLNIASPEFTRGIVHMDEAVALISLALTLSGLLFKLSVTPFHVWTPDVYEAAPSPIVAFFSTAPKIATFLLLLRFYFVVPLSLQEITAILAMATITFGNFSALWQNNAKRMLAYSTIAHSGMMLIALVILSELGVKSIVFYLVVYLFTNLAAFYLVDLLERSQLEKTWNPIETKRLEHIQDFSGLGKVYPYVGLLLLVVMISLTGLPPTAGFFAKFSIFSALWESYQHSGGVFLLILFLFGLLNTAISLYFYLKIPFYMFMKPLKNIEENTYFELSVQQYLFATILVAPLLILFFKADWLMGLIDFL